MATKKKIIRKFTKRDIGRQCLLTVLRLQSGKDAMDYPIFTIQEIKTKGEVVVTDNGQRLLIVHEDFLQVLP